jgi:hypothetical protein
MRRISPEELRELADAFRTARAWRQEAPGVYTTTVSNWTFVANCIDQNNCRARATNHVRSVEVELGHAVMEVGYKLILSHAN